MIRGIINAGNPSILFGNVLDANGNPIQQSGIASVSVSAYDLDDENAQTWSETPDVIDCVSDTYQSDPRCPRFNLAVAVDASACPNSNNSYQVQVTLTPTTGEPFVIVGVLQTRNVIGQ
jgi:hypothetical protein